MVPAGDVADQLGRSVSPPQRKRSQLQGGDPAIRRVAQVDDIIDIITGEFFPERKTNRRGVRNWDDLELSRLAL